MIDLNRLGKVSVNTQGCEMCIIEYNHARDCTIKFYNTETILFKKYYRDFMLGLIKDPYHPHVYNVGFIGIGNFSNKTHRRIYHIWNNMLSRCYNEKERVKHPTYIGCSVDERWHNFQNFAEWYENNYKEYMEGWQLDKDILCKECRIYSSETCALVPKEVNYLLLKADKIRGFLPIGVNISLSNYASRLTKNNKLIHIGSFKTVEEAFQAYKMAKEQHIKEVADKWRGKITEKVYNALINYKIEIDD